MNNNYRIALAEVHEILKYTDDNIVKKIPQRFVKFIEDNMETDYHFQVQEDLELFEQPIRDETKNILALIYRDYFCDDIEKKELLDYEKMQREIEEEIKREKYDVDKLFKKRKAKSEEQNVEKISENVEMVEVKKINFIKRIIEKIKSLFNR